MAARIGRIGSQAAVAGLAVILAATAVPSAAQTGKPAAPADVDAYVCQFSGKCDGAAGETPSIAAPATKGFRLAAPSSSAREQPASTSATAPRTRASATTPAPTARSRRPAAPRRIAPVGTRADLSLAFEYNADRLTDDAKARARVFATALMTPELRGKRFRIEGHTDSRGSRKLNQDLSRRRAEAVASFLAEQGVDRSRLEVRGYGPDRPLSGVSPAAERNRRVEAVLLS